MVLIRLAKVILRKALFLVLWILRLNAIILNHAITYAAFLFNGKEVFSVADKNIEEYESCNEYECKTEDRKETDVYIGTALCAVDQFWAKAEEKVVQMVKRRVPTRTKKLLLQAIKDSYCKLKFRLREDLEIQGVNVTQYFDPFLRQKYKKLEELRGILQRCDSTEDCMDKYRELSKSAMSCAGSFTGLEGQMSSLMRVMSSTEIGIQSGNCPTAVSQMIPVLRGVKRDVTKMLEFLESTRSQPLPPTIYEQPDEYL